MTLRDPACFNLKTASLCT